MHRSPALSLAMLVLLVWGCSSTPVSDKTVNPDATTAAPAQPDVASRSGAATPVQAGVARPMHLDPDSLLNRNHTVYFGFDEIIVRSEYASLIERHAHYLRDHETLRVVVQGNTDERGGSEYNLALGQRRAESVKTALRMYGVKEAQIEAVSFGEEKPAVPGHDESAWQRNRRADIAYTN